MKLYVIKDDNVAVKNIHHIKKYLPESIMKKKFHNTIHTDLYTVCLPQRPYLATQ